MKQREHTTSGVGEYSIDRYPELDSFIPFAAAHADKQYPDASVKEYSHKWSTCFHDEMDRVLKKAGLRS